jgi:hypothetical protein
MVLNGYTYLAAFIAILRLVIAILVVALGSRAWLVARTRPSPTLSERVDSRSYLVMLLIFFLLGLNFASWPIFYLLLQSYVGEFPGAMCIYGVMRIGEASLGPSRRLPVLLLLLQATKPVMVFAGGAWFVLYVLNRLTATGAILPRLLFLAVPIGIIAVVDASAELAYLALPKVEDIPSAGCCTIDRTESRFLTEGFISAQRRGELTTLLFTATAIVFLGCTLAVRWPRFAGRAGLTSLLAATIATACIGFVYLVDVAAPILLRLPNHHCPYDLPARVPESTIAIALFVGGVFCIGWAWTSRWLGSSPETEKPLTCIVCRMLRIGQWCILTSVCMLVFELALA